MASSSIQIIDVDEEDFDWEAAVREIDMACSKTLEPPIPPSISASDNHVITHQLNNNCRQLTLDKFLSNGNSKQVKEDDISFREEDGDSRVTDKACFVDIDIEAAKTWIYPENVPLREYQVAIAKTALFSNTLVALPTGLGKTLIAAVVMFNYFRWFPEGKVVFATPSRPLVMQQIEACHNIVGIPQEWTIDMTGLTSPPKRAALWKSKRLFFVTPQVLEKDIQSGACMVKNLVCLVIDEAHRAMGNYSYCVVVRELLIVPVQLRILALTATPGSKKETIQQVIDNLQISTLEYRSETDVDVCPYVHNRSIELIEVPMGKDADEINNLFSEVIRPIAAKLCAMGVLSGRDFQTLSPCDLLNSRDKFRQAPPPELSHVKYSEVEGYFGVLITLYHIRKLLTSHGIRPAMEMLEEKLKQGYFAKFMSRNESIQRAKVLMQKSLSHGAPSPKLSKMIEILVDHFRTNDPQKSRVIIFSNFRGSVRDILDSLAHVGHSVKATQFIGQSSGKTLKGQSHKIQQAVLEKFRTGGYNVIVATSIGEEGLDIMEVDLVICFDANISPLRMIQRMGRTGRKHDGRVVVLACEGTEVKGYKRKQATGKTVRKHMQNGGMNSFNFHCSPRMVPHFVKPELQFVQISIEKFVREAKKVKVDSPQLAKTRERLTDFEASKLEKYFSEQVKLSLVAFPSFQAYPSSVHRVMHSSRTGWLIDAMQILHGVSSSNTERNTGIDIFSGTQCLNGNVGKHTESRRDVFDSINLSAEPNEIPNPNSSPLIPLVTEETCMLNSPDRVLKISVPLPESSPSSKHIVPESSIQDVTKDNLVERSQLRTDLCDEVNVHASPFSENCPHDTYRCENSEPTEFKSPVPVNAKFDIDIVNFDFSPRLTTYIESGVVPESPLGNAGEGVTLFKEAENVIDCENDGTRIGNHVEESISTPKPFKIPFLESRQTRPSTENEITVMPPSCSKVEGTLQSPPSEFRTPLQNLTNSSSSKDWLMSSGKKSGSVEHPLRLKRLRRVGDIFRETLQNNRKEKTKVTDELPKIVKHHKVKKPYKDARDFIDEEAEESLDDVVPDSEDEEVYEDSDAYEESFIDDQSQPAIASGQTQDSKLDMMAIYRRSLLTQSPFQEPQKYSSVVTPESVPSIPTTTEFSDKIHTVQTHDRLKPPNTSTKNSVGSRLNMTACEAIPSTSTNSLANIPNTSSWKRKMISSRTFKLPRKNLDNAFSTSSSISNQQVPSPNRVNDGNGQGCTAFFDDQFYEGLDFDELEAQATRLISQRAGSSVQRRKICEPPPENNTILDPPSFDLGIL